MDLLVYVHAKPDELDIHHWHFLTRLVLSVLEIHHEYGMACAHYPLGYS